MKILMIEDRLATYVFEKLVSGVKSDHEIRWVIFNKYFTPRGSYDNLYFLNHSSARETNPAYLERYGSISRSLQYFDISVNYTIYKQQLLSIINEYGPDCVIGETTHFYEQILLDICLQKKIPFLNPLSTRYPPGRFEICLFDTDFPLKLKSKNDTTQREDMQKLAENIATGQVRPSYISKQEKPTTLFLSKLKYLTKIILTTLNGEKQVTPSVFKKISLRRDVMNYRKQLVPHTLDSMEQLPSKFLLYPLQLQPEIPLDLWGKTFKDQGMLIEHLAEVSRAIGISVVVKDNPIPKYHLNEKLVSAVKNNENVYFASNNIAMKSLLEKCDAVVTIVGTVIFEALALRKHVFVLYEGRFSKFNGVTSIRSALEILEYKSLLGTENEKGLVHLSNMLADVQDNSFPGTIFDPLRSPNLLHDKVNDKLLQKHFGQILSQKDDWDYQYVKHMFGQNLSKD